MRVLIDEPPFQSPPETSVHVGHGQWPAHWVQCPDAAEPPLVTAYRCRFDVDSPTTVRVHVTADERYELFLNGGRIGRGSERGDRYNWFFETYDLDLAPGRHVLVARVWSLGEQAPYAQMWLRPGFLFAAEGELSEQLCTGKGNWQAKRLGGYTFDMQELTWGTGANLVIDGSVFPWGFETGRGNDWQDVLALEPGWNAHHANNYRRVHLLRPATLPPMLEQPVEAGRVRHVCQVDSPETEPAAVRVEENIQAEQEGWQAMVANGADLVVPPNTARRVILDLDNYYCAYVALLSSGGAGSRVRVHWAESLYHQPDKPDKGNRNEIEGKHFFGVGDVFKPDGGEGRRFETLWWQAGRYVELVVHTGDEPLTLHGLELTETHYPLEMQSEFHCDDEATEGVIPIAIRGLQMCSHETYMDCPYYEQLMYIGDTRLEALVTYAITGDDRLPRKALRMFEASRLLSGLTQSRYPSRETQIIPPFSLWWIAMVHDFAQWRGDRPLVRRMMPGVRGVIDYFLSCLNRDGLVEQPNGWNFMDWVPDWRSGIPPEGQTGVSAPINWLLVLALHYASDLEEWLEEPELARRHQRCAMELAERLTVTFLNRKRHLFADDLELKHYSEHTQCLALLSGQLEPSLLRKLGGALLSADDLARTTIYFTHYLFETYRILGCMDAFFERLGTWHSLSENGFRTPFESPEPSRSDCHAWAAHPVFHYLTTVLGIRPDSWGFRSVHVSPQLGPLTHAGGRLVHPRGRIEVELRREGKRLVGHVVLPEELTGTFVYRGWSQPLEGGRQEIETTSGT